MQPSLRSAWIAEAGLRDHVGPSWTRAIEVWLAGGSQSRNRTTDTASQTSRASPTAAPTLHQRLRPPQRRPET
jgi:hypothetical protein